MILTTVVIVLVLQRLVGFVSPASWRTWMGAYQVNVLNWCRNSSALKQSSWHFAIAWLSFMVIAAVVLFFIQMVLGDVVYYLVGLIIVWAMIDAGRLPSGGDWDPAFYFLSHYGRIFGVLFWYVVLGLWGALVYSALRQFHEELRDQDDQALALSQVESILACADWIPTRLCSLTFVLLGHFSSQIGGWLQQFFTGLKDGYVQLVDCGVAAIIVSGSSNSRAETEATRAEKLLNRSLLFWLVVLGLLTLGAWLG